MKINERDYTLVETTLRAAIKIYRDAAKDIDAGANPGLISLREQFEWQADRALELAEALNDGKLSLKIPRQFTDD